MRIPYDKLWKAMVIEYFEEFVAIFFPDLNARMDWNIPPKFLEQELHAAVVDKTLRVADKLVQVSLADGSQKLIFIHIEFETAPDTDIGARMFEYYRRIYDVYSSDITAIVIYNGANVPKIPDRFEHVVFGTGLIYYFNAYQVRKQKPEDLIQNQNPFAIFILANLYVLENRKDGNKLLGFKEKVYGLAVSRNYSVKKIEKLLIFVLQLMKLKPNLEKIFSDKLNYSLKQNNMDKIFIDKTTINLAESFQKTLYGETYKELKAKLGAEKAKSDNTLAIAIRNLHTKMNMSIDEIADVMQLEKTSVQKMLKSKKYS